MDAAPLSLWPQLSDSSLPFLTWIGLSLLLGVLTWCVFWWRERAIFHPRTSSKLFRLSSGISGRPVQIPRIHPRYLLAWFPILSGFLALLVLVSILLFETEDRGLDAFGWLSMGWMLLAWAAIFYSQRQGDFDWLRSYNHKGGNRSLEKKADAEQRAHDDRT